MRILIIGQYNFYQDNATSITIRNLFSAYNSSQISFLFTGYEKSGFDKFNFITIERRLFPKQIRSSKIVNNLHLNKSLVFGKTNSYKSKNFKNKIYNEIYTIYSSYFSLVDFKYNKSIWEFIEKFKPNAIYSLLGSVQLMKLCIKISDKYHIPIIPHFMDDWPGVQFKTNFLLKPARWQLNHFLKNIIRRSVFGLTISQKMANEYYARYGIEFHAFMNTTPVNTINGTNTKTDRFIITYSGGLHLNRYLSLEMICLSLEKMKLNSDIIFRVYTNENDWARYGTSLKNFPFVEYCGYVSNEKMIRLLNESDILIHAESFDPTVKDYIRYSISTKIPEYLSTGKLIIAIGPDDAASIEYLIENKAALVFTSTDEGILLKELRLVLNSEDSIRQYGENARKLFMENHTAEIQNEKFRNLLTSLIKVK